MVGLWRRINVGLSTCFPEKRIFVQSGAATSYVRVTPLAQLMLGTAAGATAGWLAVATAVVVLDRIAADEQASQTLVLRDAYRDRLEELADERDQRAAEARSTQSRFQVAMDQIGRQQSTILKAVEERRELATAVELLRTRLEEAVAQRDDVAEANTRLMERMSEVSESLAEKQGSRSDLSETLHAVSTALAEAAAARDTASAERAALQQELAALELQAKINARRQDEMVEQLEQAVAMSFGPLEKMLKRSNVDVDAVMSAVRSTHSGQGGGPAVPTSVSTRSFDDAALGARFGEVMNDLDRMNLLRIAAGRIPYMMPVRSGYRFTSGYGYRRDPKGGGRRMHNGIDLAAPRGTPIFATADGVVVSAKREGGYGNVVRLRHAFGFETVYAHQHRMHVKPGQKVSRGDRIGDMGSTGRSTGVHLHYEVHLHGRPVNPMTYLEAAKDVF